MKCECRPQNTIITSSRDRSWDNNKTALKKKKVIFQFRTEVLRWTVDFYFLNNSGYSHASVGFLYFFIIIYSQHNYNFAQSWFLLFENNIIIHWRRRDPKIIISTNVLVTWSGQMLSFRWIKIASICQPEMSLKRLEITFVRGRKFIRARCSRTKKDDTFLKFN